MRHKFIPLLIFIFLSLLFDSLFAQDDYKKKLSNQEKLSAYAKLYGYVRFFYPDHKIENLDWDNFAIYGAQKVIEAKLESELLLILENLFKPVAPTIKIFWENEDINISSNAMNFETRENVVSWQHLGFSFTERPSNNYQGQIVNSHPDSARLFGTMPITPIIEDKSIGAGLRVRLPVAISVKNIGGNKNNSLDMPWNNIKDRNADKSEVRVAAIVVAWNIFRHFYPYPKLIEDSWDAMLNHSLDQALTDQNEQEFYITLREMISRLNDGHGSVRPPFQSERSQNSGFLPFRMEMIDARLFVASDSPETIYQAGDQIIAINGIPVSEIYEKEKKRHSGSPQWKKFQLIERGRIGYGPLKESAIIKLVRDDKQWDVDITRNNSMPQRNHIFKPIEQINEHLMYVDLSRADWKSIDSSLSKIAHSEKVLFDHRAYPNGNNFSILQHLLPVDTTQTEWMHIPRYLFPDQERLAGYNSMGWKLTPSLPKITGEVYWLAGGGTISYGESILAYVDHFELGTILGSASAGANGNVASYLLPGGYSIYWTGMKVTRHDGGQHHIIGIDPDIEIIPAVEDFTNKTDIILEKALKIIGTK